jgi:hypothetical protein
VGVERRSGCGRSGGDGCLASPYDAEHGRAKVAPSLSLRNERNESLYRTKESRSHIMHQDERCGTRNPIVLDQILRVSDPTE